MAPIDTDQKAISGAPQRGDRAPFLLRVWAHISHLFVSAGGRGHWSACAALLGSAVAAFEVRARHKVLDTGKRLPVALVLDDSGSRCRRAACLHQANKGAACNSGMRPRLLARPSS